MSDQLYTPRTELGYYLDWRRFVAVIAAVIVVGLAAWLLIFHRDSDSPATPGDPTAVSAEQLGEFATSLGHPVYWAGERPDTTYELTHSPDGHVFVRYLTEGAPVGDERPMFLTIATYPAHDSIRALLNEGQERDAIVERAPHGGLAVMDKNRPTSVYLAYPEADYQIEIYDPSPERALELALSGNVQPVR
jgi:hypothetical protein